MIRSGEVHVVETAEQFVERTGFEKLDALQANDIAVLAEAKKYSPDGEEPESLEDVHQDIIDELFAELSSPIVPTLQEDHREWVHLRDGPVHTIVELHPEDTEVWAEGEISTEGVSVSLYQDQRSPMLVDEFSAPWMEIISDEDPESWASFQDADVKRTQFDLG
jgi:hypothetical protein